MTQLELMGALLRAFLHNKILSTLLVAASISSLTTSTLVARRFNNRKKYRFVRKQTNHGNSPIPHDPLTGLPGRQLFRSLVAKALEHAKDYRYQVSLVLLDVDRFKLINNALGHATGDTVIQQVVARITHDAPRDAVFGRMGVDMFAVLLPNASEFEAVQWIEKTLSYFRDPIHPTHSSFHITLCAGIALFPAHGDTTDTLIQHVETAMHKAKSQGRNNWQMYQRSMSEHSNRQFELENDLRHALSHEEFALHYQPRISGTDNNVVCVEALLRWTCPGRGVVGPNEFIPVAEESGLMSNLDIWVLSTACKQGRQWLDHSPRAVRVAVNISASQLSQPGFPSLVRRILQESKLPAEYLEIEITESAIMKDTERSIQTLLKLKSMGVHISVDDFGTGYSSLSYLSRLPVDILKIDRSFIRELPSNLNSVAITNAIIGLADNLKIHITVEGVETEDQYHYLRTQNSSLLELQGYYISRPIPVEEMTNYLCS